VAYNKENIFNEILSAIKIYKLKHYEYVQAYVAPSMPTLYEFFPLESNEFNTIKAELEKNKIDSKTKMVNKWEESENATLQIAAFKLIATDEERKALSTNWNDITSKGEKIEKAEIIISRPENLDILNDFLKKE